MVIYEINLDIDVDIFAEYMLWLKEHIQKMLKFPGFVKALTLQEERADQERKYITVQYSVESLEILNDYMAKHANRLRQEGLDRFANKFKISRKILVPLAKARKEQ